RRFTKPHRRHHRRCCCFGSQLVYFNLRCLQHLIDGETSIWSDSGHFLHRRHGRCPSGREWPCNRVLTETRTSAASP
ncbi:hypothetical protein PMAYCL1PPCAC_06188, partial [Pristionchus mayeri]